jgi:hypothetical protein
MPLITRDVIRFSSRESFKPYIHVAGITGILSIVMHKLKKNPSNTAPSSKTLGDEMLQVPKIIDMGMTGVTRTHANRKECNDDS